MSRTEIDTDGMPFMCVLHGMSGQVGSTRTNEGNFRRMSHQSVEAPICDYRKREHLPFSSKE